MIPLSVRIKSTRLDRHVTAELLSAPKVRAVVPGGFASCTFSLHRPLGFDPDDLRHFAQVWVYSNLGVQFEGRIEDLGRTAGDQGEVWEITAIGPSVHASDVMAPLIYVDREAAEDRWPRGRLSASSAEMQYQDDSANDGPEIRILAHEGETISGGGVVYGDVQYRAMYDAGLKIGRIRCDVINAVTNADYGNRIVTRQGPGGAGTTVSTQAWTSGGGSMFASLGGANPIPAGDDVANIRWVRAAAGAFTAQSNNYVGEYSGIAVRCQLKDVNGNDITSGYDLNTVLATEVVKDLLGRLLTMYDGATANVEATLYNIEHLAYPDGVAAAQVLEDLIEFEPGFYWAAWESLANSKHRFEFRAWPSSIRYEADVTDGYSGPSSAAELYNKALVRYRDWAGRIRTTTRTQAVSALDDAGLTRTVIIDLGDEISSLANAQRVGDQKLAEHATPPNAGSLTIARPILDRDKNRMVMPWEIRPGHLIRVRGIKPSVDSLNATTRNGVSVFKIVAVDYDAGTGAASLELDSHPRSVARYLSALAKQRQKKRRR